LIRIKVQLRAAWLNSSDNKERHHMNHKHRKILHSLFSHPIPGNIHLHEVEPVFKELGADLDHSGHGRLLVSMNGHKATFHGADHGLSKDEIHNMKKFIETCGIEPERDYPL
jgi:hypothetical protein